MAAVAGSITAGGRLLLVAVAGSITASSGGPASSDGGFIPAADLISALQSKIVSSTAVEKAEAEASPLSSGASGDYSGDHYSDHTVLGPTVSSTEEVFADLLPCLGCAPPPVFRKEVWWSADSETPMRLQLGTTAPRNARYFRMAFVPKAGGQLSEKYGGGGAGGQLSERYYTTRRTVDGGSEEKYYPTRRTVDGGSEGEEGVRGWGADTPSTRSVDGRGEVEKGVGESTRAVEVVGAGGQLSERYYTTRRTTTRTGGSEGEEEVRVLDENESSPPGEEEDSTVDGHVVDRGEARPGEGSPSTRAAVFDILFTGPRITRGKVVKRVWTQPLMVWTTDSSGQHAAVGGAVSSSRRVAVGDVGGGFADYIGGPRPPLGGAGLRTAVAKAIKHAVIMEQRYVVTK